MNHAAKLSSISIGQLKLAICLLRHASPKGLPTLANLDLSVAVQFTVTLLFSTNSSLHPNRTITPNMHTIRNFLLSSLLLVAVAAKPDCNCHGDEPKLAKKSILGMFSPKNVKHPQAAKSVVDAPTKVTPVSFLQEDKAPLVVPHVNREMSKEVGRVLHEAGKKPTGSASQGETHVTEVAPQGFKGAAGVRVPGTVPVGGARGTPALPSVQRPSRQGGPVNTERVTPVKPARQVGAPVKQSPKELAAERQRKGNHALKGTGPEASQRASDRCQSIPCR